MFIKERIRKLFQKRDILKRMVINKFRGRYSGTIFGLWWTVVTPLILAFSINFIFTHVFKVDIPHFTLFVLSGIIPWLFFSNAINEATVSFSVDSAILKQGIFPREFVPISFILANFLSFIIGIIFLLPFFIIANPHIIMVLPLLVLVFILHLTFILGLGMIFSTFNVFFKDLMHFLSVGLMLWFWITPVFYPLAMLRFPYRWICLLNPLTYYTVLYRQVLYNGDIPSFKIVFISLLISIVFFLGGYRFFIKREQMLFKEV